MEPNLIEGLGPSLLRIARGSIQAVLGAAPLTAIPASPSVEERLDLPGAVFVTLKRNGDLRGCIGSLQAHRSLRDDCAANAVAAAFEDPRFPPVSFDELRNIRIEVSVLSAPVPFPCASDSDACARLLPGVHGVVLSRGFRRATFLPQVWEQLPDPHQFLSALRRKAGIREDLWDEEMELEVYQVDHAEEPAA